MENRMETQGLHGWVSWQKEPDGIRFRAETEKREDGLYKIYLCDHEKEKLLGPLLPERGEMALEQKVSFEELERAGIRTVRTAQARLVFPFRREAKPEYWHPAEELDGILKDCVLSALAKEVKGALIRREETGVKIAVPFRANTPFSLLPLICLGREMEWGGERYLYFDFDEDGHPRCG